MKKHLLVTGGSGYVGRHLIKELLSLGHQVSAISRNGLTPAGVAPHINLNWFFGDIHELNFGLTNENIQYFLKQKPNILIHCAGLTRFDERLKASLLRTNFEGTKNAYALGKRIEIEHFYHISTAFVAGQYSSVFNSDDLDLGQTFRNPYEYSKFLAEEFLHNESQSGDICIQIYRPGIIVGGDLRNMTLPSGTVYAYLKSLLFLKSCALKDAALKSTWKKLFDAEHMGNAVWKIPLRIVANPDTELNLVLIDDIVHHITNQIDVDDNVFGIKHVLGPINIKFSDIKNAFCEAAQIEGVEFVDQSDLLQTPRNKLESKFQRFTSTYDNYLTSQPKFNLIEHAHNQIPALADIAKEYIQAYDQQVLDNGQTLIDQALDAIDIRDAKDYLDHLTQKNIGDGLLKSIDYVNVDIGFRVYGETELLRHICFRQGEISEIAIDIRKPDCVYEMTEHEFRLIVRGVLDPREAFFSGQIKILGDQAIGLKFGYALAEYFRNSTDAVLAEMWD
ncbi:MAG: nucleoside-diphosphate-sugar epimerase [Candidatus Omnitrophota bacterium]|jgi:nucleoside-diphosphate-sugar epimerase